MLREELWRDVGALGGFPLYVLVLAIMYALDDFKFWAALIGLILSFIITVAIRIVYYKDRPVKELYNNFINKLHASTFPSWHTMRASLLATILSINQPINLLTVLLFISAAGVGYSRVKFKRHFVKDVVVGYIMGIVIAIALWYVAFML